MKDKVYKVSSKVNFVLLVLWCFSQGVRQKGVLSSQFCAVFIPWGHGTWPQWRLSFRPPWRPWWYSESAVFSRGFSTAVPGTPCTPCTLTVQYDIDRKGGKPMATLYLVAFYPDLVIAFLSLFREDTQCRPLHNLSFGSQVLLHMAETNTDDIAAACCMLQ